MTEFPAAELAGHLHHSFELTSLSWEWRENEDDFGLVQFGDPRPQSMGRIPRTVVTPRDRDWLRENLVPYRCEQQLSIPYRIQGVSSWCVRADSREPRLLC